MLAVSEDLVDMIHSHPFIADGGPNVQFNMIFPRQGIYRVWVQFQRKGVVNTVAFNIPVTELKKGARKLSLLPSGTANAAEPTVG